MAPPEPVPIKESVEKPAPKVVPAIAKPAAEKAPSKPSSSKSASNPPSRSGTPIEVKLRKGVVLSDDDDEPSVKVATTKSKLKSKARAPSMDSDAEKSLRAMMDVDDGMTRTIPDKSNFNDMATDEVEMVRKPPTKPSVPKITKQKEETPEASEAPSPVQADVEMDDDSDPAPKTKPRKRKPKKDAPPLGRNGLKKKRVVNSVTRKENGYMSKYIVLFYFVC
jgi:DNA polymerase delta subunit 3